MGEAVIATIIVTALVCYAVPSYIAYYRGHRHTPGIILLNILLGWTIIGWFTALLWSVLSDASPGGTKRLWRTVIAVSLLAAVSFVGLTISIHNTLNRLVAPAPENTAWQLTTEYGYLIAPYPFARLNADTAYGAESALFIHCRNGFLSVHLSSNLHGQLPGDAADKPVKARHRVGDGGWIPLDWTAKRSGVTFPHTDLNGFVRSLDREDADLTVIFDTGTAVRFPVWDGYAAMREHITCVQ